MKLTINDKDFEFRCAGFGAQYIYETLTGEVFSGASTRNIHLLMYSTLMASNGEAFSMGIAEFTEWLYEHPLEEEQMANAIFAEATRRHALREPKKKE